MFSRITLSIVLLLALTCANAQPPDYFLCGPDEDGCPEGDEQFCACVPVSARPEQPYCLEFIANTKLCEPVSKQPDCDPELTFKNQQSCLAALFQSEPDPPCPKVSQSFCQTHFSYLCDENGDPETCKKPTE